MEFHVENFCRLLACTAYYRPSFQTIAEKTFTDRHNTAKFAKVLSLESFSLYGNMLVVDLLSSLVYLIIMTHSLRVSGTLPRKHWLLSNYQQIVIHYSGTSDKGHSILRTQYKNLYNKGHFHVPNNILPILLSVFSTSEKRTPPY